MHYRLPYHCWSGAWAVLGTYPTKAECSYGNVQVISFVYGLTMDSTVRNYGAFFDTDAPYQIDDCATNVVLCEAVLI